MEGVKLPSIAPGQNRTAHHGVSNGQKKLLLLTSKTTLAFMTMSSSQHLETTLQLWVRTLPFF